MFGKRTIYYGYTEVISRLFPKDKGCYEFQELQFKRANYDLTAIQKFIFPIYENSHYFLISYDVASKTIKYYDSLFDKDRGEKYCSIFKRYILDLYKSKKIMPVLSEGDILISIVNDHPQQKNSYDCGVYTTVYMNLLTDGIPLEKFESKHVGIWRNLMLSHLMMNRSLY
jgi:Ulp1 family protease